MNALQQVIKRTDAMTRFRRAMAFYFLPLMIAAILPILLIVIAEVMPATAPGWFVLLAGLAVAICVVSFVVPIRRITAVALIGLANSLIHLAKVLGR